MSKNNGGSVLLFASIRIIQNFTCKKKKTVGVLVTLMVNFIEIGIGRFWITCRLVSCGHAVLGHSVTGDIS
jgi:hypothetical protein